MSGRMPGKFLCLGLLLVALGSTSVTVSAADLKAYDNPQAMDDDVLMPLPCGQSMAFRKVYTSNGPARMADKAFNAGLQQTDNVLSEAVNERHIQGPFHDKQGYYYLMGKYEVTALQYQALMATDDSKCPKPKPPLKRPQNKISWFAAQDAARRLSLYWGQKADQVKIDGQVPFARLPTDSEYEYALRGGHAVSSAQFAAPLFFTDGTLADYAWYQSPQSANGKLNAVGKLKPNPLGIFDLYGNVQEMTQDNFYATRLGRLHGQSGGFVVRGGSYLTQSAAMNAALRVEKPFYTIKGKEFSAEDTGFRLVLSLPVITDSKTLTTLSQEVTKLGYDSDDKQGALLKQLDEIIASNEKLGNEKEDLNAKVATLQSSLGSLRQNMTKLNAERDEQRNRAIVSSLRLGGFLCQSTADAQHSLNISKAELTRAEKILQGQKPDSRLYKTAQKLVQESKGRAQDMSNNLNFFSSYLSDHATDCNNNYSLKQLQAQLGNAKLSLGSDNQMGKFIERFVQLLAYREQHATASLDELKEEFVAKCYALHQQATK